LPEGKFRDCGLRFPQHLLETTSAFATLALLQVNPSFPGPGVAKATL